MPQLAESSYPGSPTGHAGAQPDADRQTDRPPRTRPDAAAVVYEHPLNERTRMLLRLEFLFEQAEHDLGSDTAWSSHRALLTLLDILALLARGDVKTEVYKELERQTQVLERLADREDIDATLLADALGQLRTQTQRLRDEATQLGQYLKSNEFIAAVRARSQLPGGLCEFDVPAYHHWLEHSADGRLRDLSAWYSKLWVLRDAIRLSLKLTRESAAPQQQRAGGGCYNQTLDSGSSCPMLRLIVPGQFDVFPEVSGGRHRITLRFMEQPDISARARQFTDDLDFHLVVCGL